MNNYILAGVSAVGGAAIGSFVTYLFCNKNKKKALAEKQAIVDEIVNNARQKSKAEEPEENTEEKGEEAADDGSVPSRETSSLDIPHEARAYMDYYGISSGIKSDERKEEMGPLTDEPKRIEILRDPPDIPDEEVSYLDLYQNGVLVWYLSGEVIDEDESERLIGYRYPLDLMKLKKAEIFIVNNELNQYFVVCVKYEDYTEEE